MLGWVQCSSRHGVCIGCFVVLVGYSSLGRHGV